LNVTIEKEAGTNDMVDRLYSVHLISQVDDDFVHEYDCRVIKRMAESVITEMGSQ